MLAIQRIAIVALICAMPAMAQEEDTRTYAEKLGWPETKVVIRFWILGILFAMLAISTLKIR